jgi:cation diffusion facilitator CzcD-associated flavoprotein CzcO
MAPIKSIAIIGAGPSGAITVDALAQEQAFDRIRVFERMEKAGGCWSVPRQPSLREGAADLTSSCRMQGR